MSPLVVLHVVAGALGLVSGAVAVFARKGRTVHRVTGTVFFLAMLVMAGLGAAVGFLRDQEINVIAGSFTVYLVATAWLAVKRADSTVGRAEIALLALALAIVVIGGASTVRIASLPGGAEDGIPWQPAGVFIAVAALAVLLDLRVLRRGGLAGVPRLSRHLWRMCLALFIGAAAFFFGQQDEFPKAWRGMGWAILPLTALALLVFWMIRVRIPPRRKPATAIALGVPGVSASYRRE